MLVRLKQVSSFRKPGKKGEQIFHAGCNHWDTERGNEAPKVGQTEDLRTVLLDRIQIELFLLIWATSTTDTLTQAAQHVMSRIVDG